MEQRIIKFRAWDTKVKKMYQNIEARSNFADFLDDNTWEVMQFTGLHDKNGKEIYQGDLLKSELDREPWKVVWRDGGFKLEPYGDCNSYNCAIREVIGNIYENPALLG